MRRSPARLRWPLDNISSLGMISLVSAFPIRFSPIMILGTLVAHTCPRGLPDAGHHVPKITSASFVPVVISALKSTPLPLFAGCMVRGATSFGFHEAASTIRCKSFQFLGFQDMAGIKRLVTKSSITFLWLKNTSAVPHPNFAEEGAQQCIFRCIIRICESFDSS